jgi:metal-responsive CopG/Arc/MetJ family transcriptional regulator
VLDWKEKHQMKQELMAMQFRAPVDLMERLDLWRGQQKGVPNRSEALRRALSAFLDREDIPKREELEEQQEDQGEAV